MIKNLRAYRIANNLQQKELGNLIGRPGYTIAAYETSSREPDIETLIKLADALKISVDELIRDNSNVFIISKSEQRKIKEVCYILQNLKSNSKTPDADDGKRIRKAQKVHKIM